jgi:hypothetical protein
MAGNLAVVNAVFKGPDGVCTGQTLIYLLDRINTSIAVLGTAPGLMVSAGQPRVSELQKGHSRAWAAV